MKHEHLFMAVTGCILLTLTGYGQTMNSDKASLAQKHKLLVETEVYLTSKGSDDRLTRKMPVKFIDFDQPVESSAAVIVDYHKTFQVMEGIGGALTDAAAETFYKLPKEKQEQILTAYFDPDKGIGYSLARTHINSCDFSSESYAYDQMPGDTSLSAFNIGHDLKYRIPLIKAALAKTNYSLKLFASPWSPPGWMKTNNEMLHGGKLKQEYASTWAKYYVKFFEAYKKEGIPFWGLTVQNEPAATQSWESCLYSAEDERRFVRDYLGPELARSPFSNLKLMIWDHNRNVMYQRAATVLEDTAAAKYVWGVAFHWYAGNNFENVAVVHDAFPDKALLFSEGCVSPFSMNKLNEWSWGEQYAVSMINDFNHYAAGWTDWNILLDEKGGPNHVQNYCFAPVIGDTRNGEIYFMNSFYYIGHFSKFVRPGAKRIACTPTVDNLMAVSFLNPDGKIATIILNKTDQVINFDLWIEKRAAPLTLPPHSIMTCIVP